MRPTCKICGKTHYSHEPHVWPDEPVAANKPKTMANTSQDMANNMANSSDSMANTYQYRDADKRREYMRDYMRKRRGHT